jgi:hypothetical protein
MPRIPTIYLETTIFNFPFADDAPQYQADTLRLFAEIRRGSSGPSRPNTSLTNWRARRTLVKSEK